LLEARAGRRGGAAVARAAPTGETDMQPLNRRQFLTRAAAGAAALALPLTAGRAVAADAGPFTLPKLPYDYDALQPSISAEIMKLHHDKHHQAYVDKLNDAVKDYPDLQKKTVVQLLRGINEVPDKIRTAVINHGGGHENHSLFWKMMATKGKGGEPGKALAKAIDDAFGSLDKFKTELSAKAVGIFGSGWGWLVVDKGKLAIVPLPNQNSPLMTGQTPILGVDVWEHAYYLQYKQARADYVKAWWDVVNWNYVTELYADAVK
jgi:Fe-Mn family superoxide dismutase